MSIKNFKKAMTAAAVVALVAPAFASCNNTDKKASDSAAMEDIHLAQPEEAAAPAKTQMPYSAEFFKNEANKAASTSAADSTYVQTASGLKYAVIKEGTGKMPKATDKVTVNYAGQLTDLDATEFDSSYQRGEPTSFPLNGVIAGWTEGLQLMKEGAVYEFYIPADLAYGERGGGPVPPNAPLIFQVELISVDGE
ncbi:MAG: FKBP-type peptidyl-prolyl cis-trans isomerase [Bacteroides sp.]|nr:FKBP-type peptidyl-prolyl cis-trans isomerase [Bacteroides sp.]